MPTEKSQSPLRVQAIYGFIELNINHFETTFKDVCPTGFCVTCNAQITKMQLVFDRVEK